MTEEKRDEGAPNLLHVYSWNVNGIKTIKNLAQLLSTSLDPTPDIIGFQETKLTRSQLTEEIAFIPGHSSYFTYSTNRSGYSGVGTYVKSQGRPFESTEGLSSSLPGLESDSQLEIGQKKAIRYLDNDGRVLVTTHQVEYQSSTQNLTQKSLTIFNVYCPRLREETKDPSADNHELKLLFHQLLGKGAKLARDSGSFVIILGDLNIAHTQLDYPNENESPEPKPNPFQSWLTDLLSLHNFSDSYRVFYPTAPDSFTCWCTKTNSRTNNYGTRLDYILIDNELTQYLTDAQIHSDIMGSDHCPISVTFTGLKLIPSPKQSQLSTKLYPEFTGKQIKLSQYLQLVPKDQSQSRQQATTKRSQPNKSKQGRLDSFFTKRPKLDLQDSDESKSSQNPPQEEEETDSSSQGTNNKIINHTAKSEWKQLLKPTVQPYCTGHSELCSLRVVRKKGPNQGRKFWACPRGAGKSNDSNSNCNFFLWA